MIEFYGNYNEEAKNFALWMNVKQNFFIVLAAGILFTGLLLLIASLFDFWIVMYFEIAIVATVVITIFSPYIDRKRSLRLLLPEKVAIDPYGAISITWKDLTAVEPKQNVKKIIRKGDCYYIVFRRAQGRDCLIQKGLLQAGTIEEFEQIFRDAMD